MIQGVGQRLVQKSSFFEITFSAYLCPCLVLQYPGSHRLHPVRGKGRSHLFMPNHSSTDISFARRRTPGVKGVGMSRNLPTHPNLEHLRKQAKDLLHELQKENPALQLADAQHKLAQEYGFASWPKLKAHIESLSGAASSAEATSEKENLFVGNWIANLSKSKRHPSNPFQNATLQFTVVGDTVTIIDVVVDESGREIMTQNTISVDGQEHITENGYVLIARWRGSNILETKAKKDDLLAGWGRYEISDDGKTLTISGDEQVIVLDRNDSG
jgi:hypothetical protein